MYSIRESSAIQLGYEITNKCYEETDDISGDETVANAVLVNIVNHFVKYENETLSLEARNIQNLTRSSDKYNQLIKFIDNQSYFVLVVDDIKNTYANKVQITTEGVVNYTLDNVNLLNVRNRLADEGTSLLQVSRTSLVQHKSILVARSAMQAIRNTCDNIRNEEIQQTLSYKHSTSRDRETQERLASKRITRVVRPEEMRYTPAALRNKSNQSNPYYAHRKRTVAPTTPPSNDTNCCTIL